MTVSKSNTPWSVKGIERDAREAAKMAAQREGMTVGAWLNQIIYSAGDPQESGGEIKGLQVDDLVTAIEGLNKRIAAEENKSAEAIDELSRTIGGAIERVQRLERVKFNEEDPTLSERVARLEEKSGDRQRIEALKALEKAVGQVALQFETTRNDAVERLDAHEAQLKELADSVGPLSGDDGEASSTLSYLSQAVEDLSERLNQAEKVSAETAQLNLDAADGVSAEFVSRTGERLRVLGDEIKRGGDQIRTLETAVGKLSSQIDAAERRSAEGVEKVSDTIAELRNQFAQEDGAAHETEQALQAAVAAATQQTEDRIAALQQSFDAMIERIESSTASEPIQNTPLAAPDTRPTATQDASEHEVDTSIAQAAISQGAPAEGLTSEVSQVDLDEGQDDDVTNKAAFSVDLDETAAPNTSISQAGHDQTDEILAQVREAFGDNFGDDDAFDDSQTDESQALEQSEGDDLEAPSQDEGAADAAFDESAFDGDDLSDNETTNDEFAEDNSEDDPLEDVLSQTQTTPKDDLDAAIAALSDEPAAAAHPTESDPTPYFDDEEEPSAQSIDSAIDELQAEQTFSDEDDQEDDRPLTKRHLTPKQRALLAARIRRKRLETWREQDDEPLSDAPTAVEADVDDAEQDTEKEQAPASSQNLSEGDTLERLILSEEERANPSIASRVASALSSLRPRFSRKDADEYEDEEQSSETVFAGAGDTSSSTPTEDTAPVQDDTEQSADEVQNISEEQDSLEDGALFDLHDNDDLGDDLFEAQDDESEQLKSSARPVTYALGGAIILAVGALGLILSDTIDPRTLFASKENTSLFGAPAPKAAPNSELAGGLAEVPAAPIIAARDIYLESVAALQSATTPQEEASALKELKKAAALGHAPAQLQLGELYKTGQGVDKELVEARLWYERAANGGNILAMHRVGVMAAQGEGGAKDLQSAIAWFEQAANRSLIDAQYNLGALYHPSPEGDASGVQDAGKAYYWYALAAQNGDSQAAALAASVGAVLSPTDKGAYDAEISAWEAIPANPSANEISPAS